MLRMLGGVIDLSRLDVGRLLCYLAWRVFALLTYCVPFSIILFRPWLLEAISVLSLQSRRCHSFKYDLLLPFCYLRIRLKLHEADFYNLLTFSTSA